MSPADTGLALPTGHLLGGTYRLEREIGRGGMGVVYEASHNRLSRLFAVKVLHPTLESDPELVRRFRREAEITSKLGHPHIVEIVDFDHPDDAPPYIVMELLEGEDLGERLRREGALPLGQGADIARQTCSALHAAHAHGIVHRDLKPRNIYLARRGANSDYVKVLDFGISKVLGAQVEVTIEQLVMGTPGYMAPEQATGKSAEVDRRTDVFAMGAILYQMLAGSAPFSADSQPATLYRIVHDEPPLLEALRPDLPDEVIAVVRRALRKPREERYPSMEALWNALARAAELEPAEWEFPTEDRSFDEVPRRRADEERAPPPPSDTVRDPTPPPQPTRMMRDRRRLWSWPLLVAVPVLLAAVGVLVALVWPRSPGERPPPGARRRPVHPPASRPAADPRPASLPNVTAASKPARRPRRPRRRRASRRRQAPRLASIHVVTSAEDQPIWAEIVVDGLRVGRSPVSVPRLGPGRHRVVARRAGYRQETRRVRLRRGQRRIVLIKLRRVR